MPCNSRRGLPEPLFAAALSASVGDAVLGGSGGGSGFDAGPEPPPSGTPAGVAGEGLGSVNCAGLVADCGGILSTKTTSGVKSGTTVVGRASVGNGVLSNVTGDVRSGLVDGDAGVGSCGVANCGGLSTDLTDGGRDGGWDCPVGGGCLGRGSDTSGRAGGGVISTSCSGCGVGCEGVRSRSPGDGGKHSGVGIEGESQSWLAAMGTKSLAPGWMHVPVVVGMTVSKVSKAPTKLLPVTACSLTGRVANDILG